MAVCSFRRFSHEPPFYNRTERVNERPTHLDLFSGIGGFSLAAEAAGFRTIAFSEIEPYPGAVLRKHWPDVPNFGDITKWRDWPDLGNVSLVTGGFPCQPHSCAGKRLGVRDDRHLWPAMRDVIGRYRPTWVCGENVPGIVGMALDEALSDLEALGYRSQPLAVPAVAVNAWHERNRIWIIAHAQSERVGNGRNATVRITPRQPVLEVHRGSPPQWYKPWQESASEFCRDNDGVSSWAHRGKAIGNSIVPQVAEVFLKAIYQQLRPSSQLSDQ